MSNDLLLALVVLLQVSIFGRCLRLAREDDSARLDGLWKQFKRDIIGRASRGDGPDWVRYMDEADRVHERRVDRLRAWATAALVVGIGGTMAALAVRLPGTGFLIGVTTDQSPNGELRGLIQAVGPALLASLSGVVNNLVITLGVFRLSDRRFEASVDEFRNALQGCSAENLPHEKFANAVRDQLGNAFREAVQTFPEAFGRLDKSVESLGKVTETQSTAVLEAAAGLKNSADGLTGAASEVVPAVELLKSSTDRLHALPDQLKQTLDEGRAAWKGEIRSDQDAFIHGVHEVLNSQQELLERTRSSFEEWEHQRGAAAVQQESHWRAAIELIQKSEAEIVKTAEALPDTFTREVGRTASTMGKQFGLEAKQHVEDLTRAIRDGNKNLQEQIEVATKELQNRFLNDTSRVVEETLDRVYRRVEGTLLNSLAEVGEGIKEALVELPANAQTFASSLSTADEKLQRSIERITESADHLKRVAELTGDFERSLAEALKSATAPSVESLRDQVAKLVTALEHSYAQLDKTHTDIDPPVKRRFKFIRNLFRMMSLRGRRDDIS